MVSGVTCRSTNAEGSSLPQRRVVVLGASNVTRSIATVVETASQVWGRPTDFLIAAGHGRSYGKSSRVLMRRLPSILTCEIWKNFFARPPLPAAALVTDVGNDIVYGASVDEIAEWVVECLRRLTPYCEAVTLTELPLASVREIDETRFVIMRSLLFPKSTLQLDDAVRKATALNAAIREIAADFQAHLIVPERRWYGLDPIHVRRSLMPQAWQKMLSPWNPAPPLNNDHGSWSRWWRLRWQRPWERELWGRRQQTPQPAVALADGTLVSQF